VNSSSWAQQTSTSNEGPNTSNVQSLSPTHVVPAEGAVVPVGARLVAGTSSHPGLKDSSVLAQQSEHTRAFLDAIHSVAPLHTDLPPGVSAAVDLMHGHVAKLCDFGCAVVGEPGTPLRGVSGKGSVLYAAPEVFLPYIHVRDAQLAHKMWPTKGAPRNVLEGGYDACTADVWSYGISLLVLATGKIPFRAASPISKTFRSFVRATQPHVLAEHEVLIAPQAEEWGCSDVLGAHADGDSSRGGGADPPWAWPRGFSPALIHLLRGCLAVRPQERFSMQQVKSHPWFGDPRWVPTSQSATVGGAAAAATATCSTAAGGGQGSAAAAAADADAAGQLAPEAHCTALFSAASQDSTITVSVHGSTGACPAAAAGNSSQSLSASAEDSSSSAGATVMSTTTESLPAATEQAQGTTSSPRRSGRLRVTLAPLNIQSSDGQLGVPTEERTLDGESSLPKLPQRQPGGDKFPLEGGSGSLLRGGLVLSGSGTGSEGGEGGGSYPLSPGVALSVTGCATRHALQGLGMSTRRRAVAVSVHGPLLSPGPGGGSAGGGGPNIPKPLTTPLPRLGLGYVTTFTQGGTESSQGPLAPRKGMVFSFIPEDQPAASGTQPDLQASGPLASGRQGVLLAPTHPPASARGGPLPLLVPLDEEHKLIGGAFGQTTSASSAWLPLGDSKAQEGGGSSRSNSPPSPSARSSPSAADNPTL